MRVLLIAEQANPAWVSVPLVGWSLSRAIARRVSAHLVTQIRNREAILAAGVPEDEFTAIDSERIVGPAYRLATRLRGGQGKGWTALTAMGAITYPYFERLVWERFGERIRQREFDVVHRITPLSPTAPSSLAGRCRRAGVPFVLGPLNGGVPWPRWFGRERRQEREWLSYVRSVYKALPGYRSTRRHASAILAGSRDTLGQMPAWCRNRCVYLPENGVEASSIPPERAARETGPLRVMFVGRLVPYKGADMLIEAAAPLVRAGVLELEVVGDGPEMQRLRELVAREGVEPGVRLVGWVEHAAVQARLSRADVLAFPSIREFGGGVVLEAMAAGAVPIVVAYGGPGELVTPGTGFSVQIGDRSSIIAGFRRVLSELAEDPSPIREMARRARARVRFQFTWDAKADQILEIYKWALGVRGDKPDFGMPLCEVAGELTVEEAAVRC